MIYTVGREISLKLSVSTKIKRNVKKQGIVTYTQKIKLGNRNYLREGNLIKLSKDFKAVVINICKELKETTH